MSIVYIGPPKSSKPKKKRKGRKRYPPAVQHRPGSQTGVCPDCERVLYDGERYCARCEKRRKRSVVVTPTL